MSKFYKTYRHNKKESNISAPLRFSFLKSIFIEGLSVKNVYFLLYRQLQSGKCITLQLRSSLGKLKKLGLTDYSKRKLRKLYLKANAGGKKSRAFHATMTLFSQIKKKRVAKLAPTR